MYFRRQSLRAFFFLFLLICLLSGMVGIVGVPVSAAPNLQVASVCGLMMAQWTFDNLTTGANSSPIYSYIDSYVASATASAGSGLTSPSISATSSQSSPNNWFASGFATGASLNTGNNDYFQFDVDTTNDSGISLSFFALRSGAGPATMQVYYSTDGATFNALAGTYSIGTAYPASAFTADLTGLTNPTGVTYLRIYGWNATGGAGTLHIDDVTFTGCLPPTPTAAPTFTGIATSTFTPSFTPIFSPTSTSTPTPGNVIISEVAWMGTQASSGDEWIEFYNTSSTSIDLTGWHLYNSTGSVDVIINDPTKPPISNPVIPANGFFLLERAHDNTVSDVTANQIYSGALSDTNDSLTLSKPDGTISDTANRNGGAWPAGTGSPNFNSMERVVTGGIPAPDIASGWVSNTNPSTWTKHDAAGNLIHGTPAGSNWGFTVTVTPLPSATFTPTRTSTPTRTNTPGLCSAGATPSSLIINEIAWAGTGASTSDQWIELYNPTTSLINLNGWILRAVDGTPNIPLANVTLPAGQYYLLERTADTTVSDVPANQIFTGAIGTFGEILQLYNASGICVDTANSNGGSWPAGDSSTRATMERRGVVNDSDTAWITNANPASWLKHDARGTSSSNYLIHGTPGYGNWAYTVTATPSPIPSATLKPTKFKTPTPAPLPPQPRVGIDEFVPRPGHDWNNDGIVNVGDEYIELINFGVIDANLSGWSLDDEVNVGSAPYRLPAVTLKPGDRMVFYGKDTGILLSDGGDAVRLNKPNGQLADAYNYSVVKYPDQSYCRLPDNGGLDDWNTNCFPTPGLKNALSGNFAKPPSETSDDQPLCPISDVLPLDFAWAECPSFGNIWSRIYWDAKGWFGEKSIPDNSKWNVYVD